MTEPSKEESYAKVIKVLRGAFGPDTQFELTRESDNVFRVKATSDDDAAITDGLEKMKADRLRAMVDGDLAVKMISSSDADDYRVRAMLTDDPMLRAGYEALARDAQGQ